MKNKNSAKILAYLLIQVFFVLNCAWADNGVLSFNQSIDCLSPAINIKAVDFQIGFKNREDFLRQDENPLLAKLDITENSPLQVFLEELGVKFHPEKKIYPDGQIPVVFENTQIFRENLSNFDPNNYSAKLLTYQGSPLLFFIETGYHPMEDYYRRYFIDFSELTAFGKSTEQKEEIKKAVRQLKKKIEGSILSRIMPVTRYCSVFSLGNIEIPVILNVHPPNDLPSAELIARTEHKIQPGDPVLDIGTGSGRIGAILAKVKKANVVAIDHKKTEVTNGKVTAAAVKVQAKMEVIESDLFNALKGRKFKYMYFYPPTLKTKSISEAEIHEIKPGAAEIDESKSIELFDRLFSEFADYLERDGVLYLALMGQNTVAYDKIKEYKEKQKITTKSLYIHPSKAEGTFEIIEVKPAISSQSAKNKEAVESYLRMPDEKEIKRVREFIKQKFKEHNIVSVYLHGSARWTENPSDWDVMIFVENEKDTPVSRGKPDDYKPEIDYRIINLTTLRKQGKVYLDAKWHSFLLNVNMLGVCIFGKKDTLDNVIKELEIKTSYNYLEAAGYMIELSYLAGYDAVDHELRLLARDPGMKKTLSEENKKILVNNSMKSVLNTALLIRKAINDYNLSYEFYSFAKIFKLWQKASSREFTFEELKHYQKTVEKTIDDLRIEIMQEKTIGVDSFAPLPLISAIEQSI